MSWACRPLAGRITRKTMRVPRKLIDDDADLRGQRRHPRPHTLIGISPPDIPSSTVTKKPQTTFGTVNVEYIECADPTFRSVCDRIRNTPWHS